MSFKAAITTRARILLTLSAVGSTSPLLAKMLPNSTPPRVAWLFDLATHFQWLYLLMGGISLVWLLTQRTYGWLLVAIASLLISGSSVMPSARQIDVPSVGDNKHLTIVTVNLNAATDDPGPLHAWLETIKADVVVVQELSHGAGTAIVRWHDYPHQILKPRDDPFGIAIISRHPLESSELLEPTDHTPQIRTTVNWGDTPFAISAVHPMPPISAEYHLRRAELFASEARWASVQPKPAIIAGDFNASPWSSAMKPLAAASFNRATTLQPTWPNPLPVIPIDQIVVSAHWNVFESGVGPDFGSDHRPAFVRLVRRKQDG